jgi:signal peptidase I
VLSLRQFAAVLACTLMVISCSQNSATIKGDAMAPTLKDGQLVYIDTSAYSSASPQRGDIVHYNSNRIDRVVGLPGETISFSGGVVSVNGSPLSEPYLAPGTQTTAPQPSYTIAAGFYFLMHDNRSKVSDSRISGAVPGSAIDGKVST